MPNDLTGTKGRPCSSDLWDSIDATGFRALSVPRSSSPAMQQPALLSCLLLFHPQELAATVGGAVSEFPQKPPDGRNSSRAEIRSEGRGYDLTFHKPEEVGSSNYTHFWMPQPLFRAAAGL